MSEAQDTAARKLAEQLGVSVDSLEAEAARLSGCAVLQYVPSGFEIELMRFIQARGRRRR